MSREHLDTIRGPIGWWALYVPLTLVVVIIFVAHYFPLLRTFFFGSFLPAAVIFAHALGIY
ncbi:MAG: hypothetical protein V4474_02495 [Patescibacteria group bacterium]